jgi:hypothetical protein
MNNIDVQFERGTMDGPTTSAAQPMSVSCWSSLQVLSWVLTRITIRLGPQSCGTVLLSSSRTNFSVAFRRLQALSVHVRRKTGKKYKTVAWGWMGWKETVGWSLMRRRAAFAHDWVWKYGYNRMTGFRILEACFQPPTTKINNSSKIGPVTARTAVE